MRSSQGLVIEQADGNSSQEIFCIVQKGPKAQSRNYLFGDIYYFFADCRYQWACAAIAVCESASDEVLFELFNHLKEDCGDTKIRLPNCPAIYEISAAAAAREISKLQTIDYFRKMLQSSSSNDPETIQELKKVLNPDPEARGTLAVVQDFISGSSLDFRLSLLHRLEEVPPALILLIIAIVSEW